MTNGCLVLNEVNDANYTSMEVLVCYGPVDYIYQVVVNGTVIPHIYDDTVFPLVGAGVTSTQQALRIGWWNGVNNGGVKGAPNQQAGYDGQGDPYGSMCVLFIKVTNNIASAGNVPDVEVLFRSAGTRVYTSLTAYSEVPTSNPAWHTMDALTWLNLDYSELDIQSFLNEAAYCDTLIPYVNPFGVSTMHPRFQMTLALRQRIDGATGIRQMLNSFRAVLVPNYDNGLLALRIKKTLAEQQPAPMDGSNYNTAISSFVNGNPSTPDTQGAVTVTPGYAAYYFSDAEIAEDANGQTTLKVQPDTGAATPNQVGFNFQDSENTYSNDSIQVTLDDDIALMGQLMPGSIQVAGINTYDQGQRIIATFFGEKTRGNEFLSADGETIGSTDGTISVSFETSVRAVKLNVADLILVDLTKEGVTLAAWLAGTIPYPPLFRVRAIQPNADFERTSIKADFHNDAWYIDDFGQTGAPAWTNGYKSPGINLVRSLLPSAAPLLSDALDPIFDNATVGKSLVEMSVAPVQYSTSGGATTARLVLGIAPPVNVFDASLQPPFVPIQGVTAGTGGELPGGVTYYFQLVALSANGVGYPSRQTSVFVEAGTNTNTIGFTNLYWDTNTTGYEVYAGIAPDQLFLQTGNYTATGGTTAQPGTITITGKLTQLGEMPDSMLSVIRLKAKLEYFPGIFTAVLTSASLSGSHWTLGLPVVGTGFAANALVGRTVAVLGRASTSGGNIPAVSVTITANTATTITVNVDVQNTANLFNAGDQITVRIQATVGSDGGGNFISDALLVNPYSGGLANFSVSGWVSVGAATVANAAGLVLRIIAGTGIGTTATIASSTATKAYITGAWVATPDATSVFVIENPAWFGSSDSSTISNSGNMGVTNFTIDASPYVGQCVLVQAVPVDINGNEGTYFANPVREVYMIGSGDTAEPPQPDYHLATDFRGNLILSEVGFPSYANVSSITGGTLQVFYWPMNNTAATATLAAAIGASDGTITLTAPVALSFGQCLAINKELLLVLFVSGSTITVARGAFGCSPLGASESTAVFALSIQTFQIPFSPEFFVAANAAAATNYQYPISLPNSLILASEFLVTNQIGNSEGTQQPYTTSALSGPSWIPVGGILTGVSNIADTFGVDGTLAIGSNLATPVQRDIITQPRQIVAQVVTAPVGGNVTININVGGVLYATLTILAGENIAVLNGPLSALTSGLPITVDIVGVGSTFPGADLGVTIFG